MKIRLSGIVPESVVDGPGVRYTIFTQGCPHHCTGCHNPKTHDPNSGYFKDIDEIVKEINKSTYLTGVTLSGGEPLLQINECLELVNKLNEELNVIIYTGYTVEELMSLQPFNKSLERLLQKTEYLVDGKFLLEMKDLSLSFRGSSNQRIINLKESLKKNKLIIQNII